MNKLVSIIVTAANEPDTIEKCLEYLINPKLSGIDQESNIKLELITVIPDEKTNQKAKEIAQKYSYNLIRIKQIIDPHIGKPHAINLAFKEAKGEYLVLTDGDVYFSKNSLFNLLHKILKDNKYMGVTGRPISMDSRANFWGYISHLLADAAHEKREDTIIKKNKFFVMSGYIIAMKNIKIDIPEDCLIEDAYISYIIHNNGGIIAYEPTACVHVKYAKNIKDFLDQKARSVGGYMQLWSYKIVTKETKVRDIWKELEYIAFPLRYAKSLKELVYSLCLYPIRAYLWLRIFVERRILKKEFYKTWVRIESTK